MKRSKFVLSFIACGLLAAVAAGCATVPKTVAVVNGVEISGDEFTETLNGFLASYGLTDETLTDSLGLEEAVKYKNNVIDEMVLQELMIQYAEENGLDQLTEQEKADVEQRVDDYLEGLQASFRADAETDAAADPAIDVEEEAKKRYDAYVETYGYSRENLVEQYAKQAILQKVYDDVMQGCTVTDEEVKAYYDENLKTQEELAQQDPETAFSDYVAGSNALTLYIPEGAEDQVRYVKHILIGLPEETQSEIAQLESEGKTEEAAALKENGLAAIRSEAEEVLKKAQAGEDFDALIQTYNEDPGMGYYPDGYMVYEGAAFDQGFLEGAQALNKVGDVSDGLVESNYGYHILKYVSSPKAGAVPYEEVVDEIRNIVQNEKSAAYWNEAVSSWEEGAAIEKHVFRTGG